MKRFAFSLVIALMVCRVCLAQSSVAPVFDVRRYGAKGDGTTDDRAAINKAIAAAEAAGNGAIVEFPRGTYLVLGYIEVNDSGNVLLRGNGSIIKQAPLSTGNQLLFTGQDNVTVENLEIDCDFPTAKGPLVTTDVSVSGGSVGSGSTHGTIKLNTSASSADDAYNGYVIFITSGAANGDILLCESYVGSTKTLTVSGTFSGSPDSCTYAIYSGSGIGINNTGDNLKLKDVTIRNSKQHGILHQYGRIDVQDVKLIQPGQSGIQCKGDEHYIDGLYVENWNNLNADENIRAIEADSQACDAEILSLNRVQLKLTQTRRFADAILVDAGDNGIAGGDNPTPFGNGGAATEDGDDTDGADISYTKFTLDAGHGFQVGDMIWISGSTASSATTGYNHVHVIRKIEGTGNVWVNVNSTTGAITLYDSADNARAGGATGKIAVTNTYQAGTNYISCTRSKTKYAIGAIDNATNSFTVTGHDFRTGMMARLFSGNSTIIHSGTASAGSSTSLTLGASASSSNDFYNGMAISITGNTGAGSVGIVTDYDGPTKVATVASWSGTDPAASSTYRIQQHFLPSGLANAGTITTSMQFDSSGGGAGTGATYQRPKRFRQVVMRDLDIDYMPSSVSQCNAIKINNTEDVVMENVRITQPPNQSTAENWGVRLGQGNRSVTMRNVRSSGRMIINPESYVPKLAMYDCEIGDGTSIPETGIESLSVGQFTLHRSTIRATGQIFRMPETELRWQDKDLIEWDIAHNTFEGQSTSRVLLFRTSNTAPGYPHLTNVAGRVKWHDNILRNTKYAGVPVSGGNVNTTAHTITTTGRSYMETGDLIRLDFPTPPSGLTTGAWYYVRKLSEQEIALYDTKTDAFADTNRRTLGTTGGGTRLLWNPQVGIGFSNISEDRGWVFMRQFGVSGNEFVNYTLPSSTTMVFRRGNIIWNAHRRNGMPQGWMCIADGVYGANCGTFREMPALAGGTLVSTVTDEDSAGSSETDLITYTLPADTLANEGDAIHFRAGWTCAANANTKTIKLYYGANTILSVSAAQNGGSYYAQGFIIRDISNLAKYGFNGGSNGGSGTPLASVVGSAGSVSADMTANITIKGTGQGTSDGDVRMEFLQIQRVPAP